MRDLHVIVNNKIATYLSRDGSIVCGNSDYRIVFSFDSEWESYEKKVARFIWNDEPMDIVFTGNVVSVPVLSNTERLAVGVYAGDLSTTTPAEIPCLLSVRCKHGHAEAEKEDVGGSLEYRLPIVTEGDEGKVLQVEDGVWKAKEPAFGAPMPVAYLYNGVELPPLPEWDKTAYPYAIIAEAYLDRGYVLWTCSEVIVAHENWMNTGNTMLRFNGVLTYYKSWKSDGTDGWNEHLSGDLTDENVSDGSLTNSPVLWVSFDMRNQENAVYLAASEPVPVYSGGTGGSADAVLYTPQTLTPEQQAQARANIGAEAAPEPTAYLYNGVELPKIPAVEGFEYAVIEYLDADAAVRGGQAARLILSSEPIWTYSAFQSGFKLRGNVQFYGFANDSLLWGLTFNMSQPYPPVNEWSKIGEEHYSERTAIIETAMAFNPIWANHDVYYEGASYSWPEASEPIPVYPESGSAVDAVLYTEQTLTPEQQKQAKKNLGIAETGEDAVQSVNGQTGDVQLSAADVGARPDDWIPTAQEVGALPNTYIPPNQTAEQVGADPKGTAASAVSQHNTADDSHNDIRLELKAINDRLTAFFDSDNQTLDELSEIVAYITSNKSLIDAITTSKVSVTDIINNLATNVANKPLSAAQGVVLKGLIDTLSGNLANYQPKGDYALRDELPAVPVKSVNGKTGDVSLGAADVKARPDSWMPTASDVGALSNSELPSAINTALAQAKASGEFDGKDGKDGKDYTFDPTAYGLPVLYLTGDTTGMSKDNEVTLGWTYGENSGSCTLKWQGSSSLAYEKKNYTIKFDNAFEAVEGWGSQKKYCLKANYIDHTHARNVVSAKLWGQIVASRSPSNSTLNACPNYGAVDGFPVVIALNGEFHGLYTFNIPKDGWMFNLGSGTQEAVICADENTPAVDLRVHSKVDGDDHELEYVTDENSAAWVATSLNCVIDMLVNSYGADLDTTIAQYLDWESAIDYYILTVIMDGRDMTGKNYIMATWNGSKWVFSAYDMDSTYGLHWDGSAILPPNEGVTFESFRRNRVMELIYRFKTNALKARYKQLRESVLSEYSIGLAFENFGCGIPSRLLDEDAKKWPSLPSTSVNTTDQILRWLHHRLAIVDKWVEELPAQETPVAPENRTDNVVSVSTDTDGSIFNSAGYKDGYTINNASDGTESEVVMDGCCITGFIPVTKENVIKVTTDHWNLSPTNSRIIFYDMDLKPMAYYTQHGFVGLFNGYTNATAILAKDKQSVTYNADGTTTLNIAYGANCTNLGYIRIRGVGKGANLAVIREGEIPEHAPDFEPEVQIDNWIPYSIDASGAIYNGTGYKDDTRATTNDPDVEETKTGMFQTGFIPLKMTDVIRVASDTWGTSPSNAKIVICNAQFKAMAHYTANGYVGTFNGYISGAESNVTSLKSKDLQSVTKGSDGFTTLNLVYGNECTDVAYFRYTGCGSGANAVIKLT